MKTKKHNGRDDLIGEHSFGDAGQVIFIIIFLIVYIADAVYSFSTFLNEVVPVIIRILSGTILMIAGGFLSLSALRIVFGEVREKPEVIRKGVFSFTRHPVYLGEIVMYLALLSFSVSIAGAAVWIMVVVFLHYIARYEEKILLDYFGEEYRRYMNEVPRWLPKAARNKKK